MNETPEPLIPMNLSFSGRTDDARPIAFAVSREDFDPTRHDRTVEEVRRLRGINDQIVDEIEKALFNATGLKFTATLSFHHGSVEFQGIVSTLATSEIFQATANFGGALALAQTVAAVINSVVAPHLPEWMGRPITTCRMLGHVAPLQPQRQDNAKVHSTWAGAPSDAAKELRAIKWLLFGIFLVITVAASRYIYLGVA